MFRGSLVIDAATEAEVRVHTMPSGKSLASFTVHNLTVQSAERPDPAGVFGYEAPEGGPEVLAQFLEHLAARVRIEAAALPPPVDQGSADQESPVQ